MVATLENLKDKLSKLVEEDKKSEMLGEVGLDYVLEYEDTNKPFQTFSLNTERDVQKLIIKEVRSRIGKYKDDNVIDFDFTKELGHHQIGRIALSDCPERLGKMISASNQPNRKSFSLSKNNKNQVVAYVTTISDNRDNSASPIKVIKKMNLASILSKNKKKAQIGLIKGTVKGVPKDLVLIAPESFDLIVVDDTVFVLDERNFHFLFSGTEYLKKVIKANSAKLDSAFDGSDALINYAERNPSVLRGLYHVLTKQKTILLDNGKIHDIENRIKKQTGSSNPIFDHSNEKIVCTKDNAKYIYWLLAKKYALNLLGEDIFVTGSQYPIK